MKKIFLAAAILFASNINSMAIHEVAVPHLSSLINDLNVDELMFHLDENNPASMRYEKSLTKDQIIQLKEFAKKRLYKSIEDSRLSFFDHKGGFPKFQVGLGATSLGIFGMIVSGVMVPTCFMGGSLVAGFPGGAIATTLPIILFLLSKNEFDQGSKLLSEGWNIAANNLKKAQQICWIVNKLK